MVYLNASEMQWNTDDGLWVDTLQHNIDNDTSSLHYISIFLKQLTWVTILACVLDMFYLFIVIPSNIFTVFVISKTKSLWTASNAILAINGFFQAVGCTVCLPMRFGTLPNMWYDEKQREIHFMAYWWINSMMIRIGNFSYLLLGIVRYCTVCLEPSSRLHQMMKETVNIRKTILLLLAIITPSTALTVSIFFANPASGKVWRFQYSLNSSNIMAFQEIRDEKRNTNVVVIGLGCYQAIQLTAMLGFYLRILCMSYGAFLNAILKPKNDSGTIEKRSANVSKKQPMNIKNDSIEEDVGGKSQQNTLEKNEPRSSHLLNTRDQWYEGKDTKRTKITPVLENNLPGQPQDTQGIYTIRNVSEERNQKHVRKYSQERLHSKGFDQSSYNQNTTTHQLHSKYQSLADKHSISKVARKRGVLPTAGDYKTTSAPNGAYKFNVPLTDVVLCVSKKDIICTASLASQFISLLLTFVLGLIGIRVTGQIVTLDQYLASMYCIECALFINTIVDPMVCVLFSKQFRQAAREIICPNKNKNSSANSVSARFTRHKTGDTCVISNVPKI